MSHNANTSGPIVIDYWATVAKCKRCTTRKAESSDYSAFQLCAGCAADLCPGPDVKRYNELKAQYGYAE